MHIEVFKNRSFEELNVLSQILDKYEYKQNKINFILKDLKNSNIDITKDELIYYIEKYK